jgi:lysophospholipase L1-like esterase
VLECLILGDSLAVGIGQARPECRVEAKVGISSQTFIEQRHGKGPARTVVISLGVNDRADVNTVENLTRLRQQVRAQSVVWVITGDNPRPRDAVRTIAHRFNDRVIDATPLTGPDRLHPDRSGYAKLASLSRARGRTPVYNAFPPRPANASWCQCEQPKAAKQTR